MSQFLDGSQQPCQLVGIDSSNSHHDSLRWWWWCSTARWCQFEVQLVPSPIPSMQVMLQQQTSVLLDSDLQLIQLNKDSIQSNQIPPLQRGFFYAQFSGLTMVSACKTIDLQPWQQLFYEGDRLSAEVQLLAAAFVGDLSQQQLVDGCALLQASFGTS